MTLSGIGCFLTRCLSSYTVDDKIDSAFGVRVETVLVVFALSPGVGLSGAVLARNYSHLSFPVRAMST